MNLMEELRSLDPRDPGRWPLAVRAGAVGLCFVLVTGLVTWYFFVWTDLNPQLQQPARTRNGSCATNSKTKHAKATNLDVYTQQLADIEKSFGAMLRQLPSKTEVDNLLVDISQTGPRRGARPGSCSSPRARCKQGFLRRAADQDPLRRQLPPVRRLRQRHRGAPAHRDAA